MDKSPQRPGVVERRTASRVTRVAGTATVLARRNQAAFYVVRNLSSAGALLIGECPLAAGEDVHVLLQLDNCASAIATAARVVRGDPVGDGQAIAIEFTNVADDVRAQLQDIVRGSWS